MAGGTNVVPQSAANIQSDSGYDTANSQVAAFRGVNPQTLGGYNVVDMAVSLDPSASIALVDSGGTNKAKVDANGNQYVIQGASNVSSLTSIAAATASTQLLAANTSRKGMYVYNDSTAILYLAFAGSASTTAYTLQIPSGGFFEMPIAPTYTGAIYGIWSAANGNARITELS